MRFRLRRRRQWNDDSYNWFYDKKIHGMLILFVSICFLFFNFLDVVFLSSINAYTIGMLLGFYAPFFYLYTLYIGIELIFVDKIKKPAWIKITKKNYWLLLFIIIFLSSSSGFYQLKSDFTSIGLKPWKTFNYWFDNFTNNGGGNAWFPGKTNGGLLGVFIYSCVATIFSGIGAIVIAGILLFIFISLIFTGSVIELYKNLLLKRKLNINNEKPNIDMDDNSFEKKKITKLNKIIKEKNENFRKKMKLIKEKKIRYKEDYKIEKNENHKENHEEEIKEKNNLPFDDPF